jgi:Ni,Fe-hydrogenase III large subunit
MTLVLQNASAAPIDDLPRLLTEAFRRHVIDGVAAGGRIGAFFGVREPDSLLAVAAIVHGARGEIEIAATELGERYPAITPECAAAQLFERALWEEHGVVPEGHPWLKPVRFTRSDAVPGVTDHFHMSGDEIHEVAVGPVHAGVIEPGHFRFQCHGENVFHLEISLGYQHRGIGRALIGGPNKRTVHVVETIAGDSTVAHATAYAHVMEALAGREAPPRAHAVRAIALELERLANHVGDLGALANDVAYLPTASYCGRIRGDFLNATARICGNRFGRGLVRPGGVQFDIEPARASELRSALENAIDDARGAVELLWKSPGVIARFEDTGVLSRELATELGLVGPAARACGIERDVRQELPIGMWRETPLAPAVSDTGDVLARARVRWAEAQRSADIVRRQLDNLPHGELRVPDVVPRGDRIAIALVEGWRGEVCHVAITDRTGRFARYETVDPSFHNWIGLAMALRDQPISDFPLCNKSFNLSYCGHDL